MQIERTNSDALVIDKLPDGSRVIIDTGNETVFALNATAGAAWDACSSPTTLSGVAEKMLNSFDPGTTEELAQEAILQLEDHNLVKTSGPSSQANRRQFIASLSAIALPLVVSLTMTDQRAYARSARSGMYGDHGHHGDHGHDGNHGHHGDPGHHGDRGPVGHLGPIGPVGPVGPIGHLGPVGNLGSLGGPGHIGPLGEQGHLGPLGDPGAITISMPRIGGN